MQVILYYWYHHGMPELMQQGIQKALDEKNYAEFLFYYTVLNNAFDDDGYSLVFLPDTADVFDGDNLVSTINILDYNNFMKITGSDCEHG